MDNFGSWAYLISIIAVCVYYSHLGHDQCDGGTLEWRLFRPIDQQTVQYLVQFNFRSVWKNGLTFSSFSEGGRRWGVWADILKLYFIYFLYLLEANIPI